MAERRRSPKDFTEDKIVRDLVPDPGQPPPDAVVLHGFMGKSDRDGYRRLYLDESLTSWVEIPEDEILHVETTPEDESGTAIWVKRTAQLETKQVQSTSAPADFLSGDIARTAGGLGIPGREGTVFSAWCEPFTVVEIRCPGPQTAVCTFELDCRRTPWFPCRVLSVDIPCQRTPDLACPRTPRLPCPRTPRQPCPSPIALCEQRTPFVPCEFETAFCSRETALCPRETALCPNTPFCGGPPGGGVIR